MRSTIHPLKTILLLLFLAGPVAAQTSIPLPPINVTPPTPTAFSQAVNLPLNTTATINGVNYIVSGTLAGSLTFTPQGSTTGSTTGFTTGTTTGSTTGTTTSGTTGVTTGTTTTGTTTGGTTGTTGTTTGTTTGWSLGAAYNLLNQPVTTAPSGSTIVLHGNLPPTATVTIAGLSCTVTGGSGGQLTIVLPTVPQAKTGPIIVTAPDGTVLTGPPFTITGSAASLYTGPLGNYGTGVRGFADADGYWTDAFSPGDTCSIFGWGFGATTGSVEVDDKPATIMNWQDREINVTLPTALNFSSSGTFVSVMPPASSGWCGLAFNVVLRASP